ncbi:hypothetical protein OEZ85_013465 [Tetradesmus obliquus]|uniref:Peptidase C1A papain C-terminal domain-containing protein n=1 Tax=Tetradesmus obliquus TaxID=3088 RepID=A0ABY8UQC7_TETOB|nr:hypothetical protein OEZ85_013465 [Tetradesmus obliquus]
MFEEVPIKAKPDTVAWLQEIQHNIERYGSVVTCMRVDNKFFLWLRSDNSIKETFGGNLTGDIGGHCVNVVGWDYVDASFLMKNSWGDAKHDHGYFKLGFEANVGALTTAETVTYVPAGTLARQSKRVAPAGGCIKHTVRAGETTYGIAYNYNADAANVLRNPDNAAAFERAASLAYPKPGSVLTVCA